MDLEEIFFPWIKVIKKKMLKSFPIVKEKTLDILLNYIHDELKNLDVADTYRAEILYETLSYFHFHFIWKVNWNEESYLLLCCVQLLYYITYIALILSSGNVQSPWLNKAISTLSFSTDNCEVICDILLLIRNIPSKYLSAYKEILRSALISENIRKPVDAQTFIKIMLLFRRFKSLIAIGDTDKRTDIYNLASKVNCPVDTINFLSTINNDDEYFFTERNIFKKFLKKNLKGTFIKNLFEILFRNKYSEKLLNFSANVKRNSKSTRNISVRQNNVNVCCDIKNKSKHNKKKNVAKGEKIKTQVLKKSKKKKKKQKVHSEKESVGSGGTIIPIPISFSGEQHIESKVNSHDGNENCDNFQVKSREALNCEETLSKKQKSKKRAFSPNFVSFTSGFVNNLSPQINKKRKTSSIVSYEDKDSVYKNSDHNQNSYSTKSSQVTKIPSKGLISQNEEIHCTDATLNGEVRNLSSKKLLLNEDVNDHISKKVVSKSIDSNKEDKFATSPLPIFNDRSLVSSKLNKHNKNSSLQNVNDANKIPVQNEYFAPVDNENHISNISEIISRNNVDNKNQPNDFFKIDVNQNELVDSKICMLDNIIKVEECVEIKSEIPCDKPLSTFTLTESNVVDYLDTNTCFITKEENEKCDNDLKLCSEENIYNTSTPRKQKSCSTPTSYMHDYEHFASPESLDLNVTSIVTEYSKVNILEKSRSIYTTTDSSGSSSPELQEIMNPKDVKRKKNKRRKLSKSNFKSLSVDEMKNNKIKNLNDSSTTQTKEISLENHTKAMDLNSGLFSKSLPSSENVSESPDNLKVSVENGKVQRLQTDIGVFLEPKVCSLSNVDFADSIKRRLRSRDTFPIACNESNKLNTPKRKTSKPIISSKLSLKVKSASPLKVHSKDVKCNKKTIDLSPNKLFVNRQKTRHKEVQECKEKLTNSVSNKNISKVYNEKQHKSRKHFSDSSSSSENELNISVNEAIETLDNSVHDIAETSVVSFEKVLSKNPNISEVEIESFPKPSSDLSILTNANSNKCFDSKKEDRKYEILLEDKKNLLDQNSTFIRSSTNLIKRELRKTNITIEPPSEISSDSCYELNESNHFSEENELNSDSSDELNVTDRAASFNTSIQIQSKKVHLPESKVKTLNSLKSCLYNCTNSTNKEEECETLQENKDDYRNKENPLASLLIDKNINNSEKKKIKDQLMCEFLPKPNLIIWDKNESPKSSTNLPVIEDSLNPPLKTPANPLQTQTGFITSESSLSYSTINASQNCNECTGTDKLEKLEQSKSSSPTLSRCSTQFPNLNDKEDTNLKLQNFNDFSDLGNNLEYDENDQIQKVNSNSNQNSDMSKNMKNFTLKKVYKRKQTKLKRKISPSNRNSCNNQNNLKNVMEDLCNINADTKLDYENCDPCNFELTKSLHHTLSKNDPISTKETHLVLQDDPQNDTKKNENECDSSRDLCSDYSKSSNSSVVNFMLKSTYESKTEKLNSHLSVNSGPLTNSTYSSDTNKKEMEMPELNLSQKSDDTMSLEVYPCKVNETASDNTDVNISQKSDVTLSSQIYPFKVNELASNDLDANISEKSDIPLSSQMYQSKVNELACNDLDVNISQKSDDAMSLEVYPCKVNESASDNPDVNISQKSDVTLSSQIYPCKVNELTSNDLDINISEKSDTPLSSQMYQSKVNGLASNDLDVNISQKSDDTMSLKVYPYKISQLTSNDSDNVNSGHDLSPKENSLSFLQSLILSGEIQISFSHENTSTPLKRSNSISSSPEVDKNILNNVLDEMPINSVLKSKSVDLTQSSQMAPKNLARNTITEDHLKPTEVKVFSPKCSEIGDKFSFGLNNCSIIEKSPFKQNQKSLDISDLAKNKSPNYCIESNQLGENLVVSVPILNNSNYSSSMSPPVKLSVYQKEGKIISDSDSNSFGNTSAEKVNKESASLKHATENKSGKAVSTISSCFKRKSGRLASESENSVDKSHSENNTSDDSKSSLNKVIPKSDSVISSKKHGLKRNKFCMYDWMKCHGVNPESFINFSASEADYDNSDCSLDSELEDFIVSDHVSEPDYDNSDCLPDSDLEDFIVPDHELENESEKELNNSTSSINSHCSSKRSFVGRKFQRIKKNRTISSESDDDSFDDKKSEINTQQTKLRSKRNKILSESDSDDFCDHNSSNTTTNLTPVRKGKSSYLRKNNSSNFKRRTSDENNSSTSIKKNITGNSETNRTSFEIGCNTSNDQDLSNSSNPVLTVPKSSSNHLSPKCDSRSLIKHNIRNNPSQSSQSVNNVVQESASCKLNLNSSHSLPDIAINSKGRKRKYNKSTVSLPSQNPYNLRKRKSHNNLTDTLLSSVKVVSTNQNGSSNKPAADSDSKQKNSEDTLKDIHLDPVQNSKKNNSNKLQVSSVLKVNCDELAEPCPSKNKKVLTLHNTKKCSTPKKSLSSKEILLNVSDTDSDKTCLLQNASVIEKQMDLGISEKSDTLCRDLNVSDYDAETLTKSSNSMDISPELSKRNKTKIDNSNITIQKRRTVKSTVNNKKEQCNNNVTNNKQNMSKNMKEMLKNSVQEFSPKSIINSLENALPLSITENKNCGLYTQVNKEFSDSLECVSPTQIQKNVLNFIYSCNSFECISSTQSQNDVLKHSTASYLSQCISPTQIQKNAQKNFAFDSSECSSLTQIPKDNQKNSNPSECAYNQKAALKNSFASPTQTQNDDQQNSGISYSYEYIPPTQIQKNNLEKSKLLTLYNLKNFDNYQKEILSDENSCSLINPSKNIIKGNCSAKNLSQSVGDDSQVELGKNEVSENNLLSNIQKTIKSDSKKCSVETNHKKVGNLTQLLKHFTNSDKIVCNLQKNHPSSYTRLFENHILLQSKKDTADLTLKKTQKPPDVLSQNEPPCNDILYGNMENSDHSFISEKDKENLSQEFLVESGDERLMCAVVDKYEENSTSLISDNFLKDISVDDFMESPCEQNIANKVISSDQLIKPSLLCKDNNISLLKTKELSLNTSASIVSKPNQCLIYPLNAICDSQVLQYVPKANCDVTSSKNCIVNTNCNMSVSQVDSLNLDMSHDKICFVNTNYGILPAQINALNLDPCIELIQSDKLTNSGKRELRSSDNSSISLDHQLSQMGFEKQDPEINLSQNSISRYNQAKNAKNYSETAAKSHLKKSMTLPKKLLILCDVTKDSYEICPLLEEIPCSMVNKPAVTHSESQTDINDSEENIDKTNKKMNDCNSEEFIIVNGTKYSKASFDPVVNIGKKCDDIEIKSNNNNKIETHPSRICQKSEKITKQSGRKRKNKLCGCPEC